MHIRSRSWFVLFLGFALALLSACSGSGGGGSSVSPTLNPPPLDPLFEDIERRTFNFFWETTDSRGLVHDRYPTPSFASVAAIGWALTVYPIGVERGYVTRAEARTRTLDTLRFLYDAPQGPEPTGNAGYKGFYYHFLEFETGTRYRDSELSTVDTGLLLMGALFAATYFDQQNAEEAEIRKVVDDMVRRVDWQWAQPNPPAISHGWHPETGFIASDWRGYNEAMFVYLLALASPTHPVGPDAWAEWTRTYDQHWGTLYGQTHLTFGPLFGHQFAAVWIDFRGIRDPYMAARGFDYFENSRRATYSQRAYAIANPLGWKGYGANVWGLSACDGPVDADLEYNGQVRKFLGYSARGVNLDPKINYDDGTIAPYAVIASLPFAPEIVIPAVLEMHRRWGADIYGQYGFFDSFNPSYDFDLPPTLGRKLPGGGWADTDYLGLDQGPVVAMIENYRSEFVWKVMRRNAYLQTGLKRAGFTGGWLQ